jgi:hypothetical protein
MKTYHVLICHGEYDDYSESFVKGYRTADKADDLKEEIEKELQKIGLDTYYHCARWENDDYTGVYAKREEELRLIEIKYNVSLGSPMDACNVKIKEFEIED